jgi:integrase
MTQQRASRRRKLTDRFVQTVKPPAAGRLDFTDTEARGLVLRVTAPTAKHPNGLKSWAVRYRPKGGAQQRETIGVYSKSLSLAKARQRAMEVIAAASRGQNLPDVEATQRQREAGDARTVGDLLKEYVEDYGKANQRRWKLVERLFERHVKPHLGSTRLVDLRRHDVAGMLDKLQKAGLRAQVNLARAHLIAALNWGIEARGYLEANPAAMVKRRKALETARTHVLSDAELRSIWLASDRIGGTGGAMVKLLILTGQRRDEVRQMPRDEIRPGTTDWVLPAKRNKGKRDHLVPLPPPAAAIIDGLPKLGRYVLTLGGKKPYANHTRLKIVLDRESGVTGWTYHDLRRTCASGMAALHVSQDTIDSVLNHAKGKLARTYNVYQYRDEKAAALKVWAERVAIVVGTGRDAPNVRELRPSA